MKLNQCLSLLLACAYSSKVQDNLLARANDAKADADKALKLFNSLGNVDQALEKLKG